MTVRCKMKCESVTQRMGSRAAYNDPTDVRKVTGYEQGILWDAQFRAVHSERADDENKRFWDATPSGEFKVATIREMPWEIGKTYYIDVTEAPD